MVKQRLQKLMAACGVGSRRECEEIITQGRVTVDRKVVTQLGTQVDPDVNDVACDGERLRPPRIATYLLNKPRGVICSTKTRRDQPRAVDYAPPEADEQRLFTIGRLDVDSEGALLLTNDGELCHLVSHPRFQVEKSYRVEVQGEVDEETLSKMRKGVWLAEGRTGSLRIKISSRRAGRTVLDMTLNEGMKREIRRVCARFGHEVRRLRRIAIGPIELGDLPIGAVRELTEQELDMLRDSAEVVIRLAGGSPRRPVRSRNVGGYEAASAGDAPRGKAPAGRGGARSGGKSAGGRSGARGKGGPKSDARGGKSGGGRSGARGKASGRKSSGGRPGGASGKTGGRGKRPGGPGGARRSGGAGRGRR